MPKEKPSLIVKNKNASRNYKLDESFQAGIVLEGWEVKSLRQSKVDVKNSYVNIKKRDWERDQGRILKNSKKFS